MNCNQLTKGLAAAQCNKSAVAGTDDYVILLNFDDVDKSLSVLTGNVLSSIIMEAAKKGFKFESYDNSIGVETTLKNGKYRTEAEDNITIRTFVKTQFAKDFIESAKFPARVIAIVPNKEVGAAGDTKYEAHGWDCGLQMLECKSTSEFADGVTYEIKLGFADSKEGGLPKSIFITDLKTTETMINALI